MYLSYEERLHFYERDKRRLQNANLTAREYELAIRKLADKWRI